MVCWVRTPQTPPVICIRDSYYQVPSYPITNSYPPISALTLYIPPTYVKSAPFPILGLPNPYPVWLYGFDFLPPFLRLHLYRFHFPPPTVYGHVPSVWPWWQRMAMICHTWAGTSKKSQSSQGGSNRPNSDWYFWTLKLKHPRDFI